MNITDFKDFIYKLSERNDIEIHSIDIGQPASTAVLNDYKGEIPTELLEFYAVMNGCHLYASFKHDRELEVGINIPKIEYLHAFLPANQTNLNIDEKFMALEFEWIENKYSPFYYVMPQGETDVNKAEIMRLELFPERHMVKVTESFEEWTQKAVDAGLTVGWASPDFQDKLTTIQKLLSSAPNDKASQEANAENHSKTAYGPFKDLNLKISVISALHELGYYVEEAERIQNENADWDQEHKPIPAVLEFYTNLQIDQNHLDEIEGLYPDGGDLCYQYLFNYWDGEDNQFDITSLEGIEVLTNLKIFEPISMIGEGLDYSPLLLCKNLEKVAPEFINGDSGEILKQLEDKGVIIGVRLSQQDSHTSIPEPLGFDAQTPKILVFSLSEFEEKFGKLEIEISKTVYESPFYIYDSSLRSIGPKFPDEEDISDEDCKTGFKILDKIWLDYIAHSSAMNDSPIFKKEPNPENGKYFVSCSYGFAPGYDLDAAVENIARYNCVAVRWDAFWIGDETTDKQYRKRLPHHLNEQVKTIAKEADAFQMAHDNLNAATTYAKANELLPEPKNQWDWTSSLLRNIAENYYLKAFYDCKSTEESKKYYLLSLKYFKEYMKNPSEVGYAVNHGKIGQIWYELGDFENANEELMRAYMDKGKAWFDDLDPKYYDLIRPLAEHSAKDTTKTGCEYYARAIDQEGNEIAILVNEDGMLQVPSTTIITSLETNALKVFCRNNQLEKLLAPNAIAVGCKKNNITNLHLENAETVRCEENMLTELYAPKAKIVNCSFNQFTHLVLESAVEIDCYGNKLLRSIVAPNARKIEGASDELMKSINFAERKEIDIRLKTPFRKRHFSDYQINSIDMDVQFDLPDESTLDNIAFQVLLREGSHYKDNRNTQAVCVTEMSSSLKHPLSLPAKLNKMTTLSFTVPVVPEGSKDTNFIDMFRRLEERFLIYEEDMLLEITLFINPGKQNEKSHFKTLTIGNPFHGRYQWETNTFKEPSQNDIPLTIEEEKQNLADALQRLPNLLEAALLELFDSHKDDIMEISKTVDGISYDIIPHGRYSAVSFRQAKDYTDKHAPFDVSTQLKYSPAAWEQYSFLEYSAAKSKKFRDFSTYLFQLYFEIEASSEDYNGIQQDIDHILYSAMAKAVLAPSVIKKLTECGINNVENILADPDCDVFNYCQPTAKEKDIKPNIDRLTLRRF